MSTTFSKQPISEANEQKLFIKWLRLQHPNLIVIVSIGGIKLTLPQVMNQKALGLTKGIPDIFIAEPNGKYCGLFIELKKSGTKLKTKKGTWINEHIEIQAEMIEKLKARGYYATFCIGFEEAKNIIDNYLNNKL